MLSRRRLLPLGIAVLLSGGTVIFTQQWIERAAGDPAVAAGAPAAAPTRVLVAGKAVPAGAALTAADLRWQAWPADAMAPEYLSAGVATLEQVVGAVARTRLTAGEPVTMARVAQPGARGFLAAMLQPGLRAVTVSVTASTGVAGFVFPGDRVDLILSQVDGGGGGANSVRTETLISDVRVLGMDQRASNDAREIVVPQTATLEVTPRQAERIARAAEIGKLSLSLRSLGAGEAPSEPEPEPRPQNARRARPAPAAKARAADPLSPPSPAMTPVRVIRGDQLSAQGGVQ